MSLNKLAIPWISEENTPVARDKTRARSIGLHATYLNVPAVEQPCILVLEFLQRNEGTRFELNVEHDVQLSDNLNSIT